MERGKPPNPQKQSKNPSGSIFADGLGANQTTLRRGARMGERDADAGGEGGGGKKSRNGNFQ